MNLTDALTRAYEARRQPLSPRLQALLSASSNDRQTVALHAAQYAERIAGVVDRSLDRPRLRSLALCAALGYASEPALQTQMEAAIVLVAVTFAQGVAEAQLEGTSPAEVLRCMRSDSQRYEPRAVAGLRRALARPIRMVTRAPRRRSTNTPARRTPAAA